MKSKFASRKFLTAAASILGSIAAAIAGFATDNQVVIVIGIVCGIVSAGIYEIVEAVIDCETSESGEE